MLFRSKEQITDLNRRIQQGGVDGEKAKQELAQINEDPIKFYENRKNDARENLTEETELNKALETYDNIINKIQSYDKENKSRLSGEVGVGEKPIEAKPIEGAGKEETTTGGVLQAPGVSGEGEGVGEKVTPIQGIEQEQVIKQMKPFTDKMVDIEREFKNNGFEIDTDYDNEITIKDKNGELIEPDELPDNLKKLAADYEKATMKLGDFDASAREKALNQSREIIDTEAKIVETKKAELPKPPEAPKEGDKVTLPPQVKGGIERTMVFNEGEWKQQVGDNMTSVGERVKEKAQQEFDKSKEAVTTEAPKKAEAKVEEPKKEAPKVEVEVPKQEEVTPKKKPSERASKALKAMGIAVEGEEAKVEPELPKQEHTAKTIDKAKIDVSHLEPEQQEIANKVINDAKRIIKTVDKLVKKGTGNDLKVVFHPTEETAAKEIFDAAKEEGKSDEQARQESKDAVVRGWWDSNKGEIHIVLPNATKELAQHELFHPILDFMEKNNPDVVNSFAKQLKGLENGQEVLDNAETNYAVRDENGNITNQTEVNKEAITDYIAKVANGDISLTKSN